MDQTSLLRSFETLFAGWLIVNTVSTEIDAGMSRKMDKFCKRLLEFYQFARLEETGTKLKNY